MPNDIKPKGLGKYAFLQIEVHDLYVAKLSKSLIDLHLEGDLIQHLENFFNRFHVVFNATLSSHDSIPIYADHDQSMCFKSILCPSNMMTHKY